MKNAVWFLSAAAAAGVGLCGWVWTGRLIEIRHERKLRAALGLQRAVDPNKKLIWTSMAAFAAGASVAAAAAGFSPMFLLFAGVAAGFFPWLVKRDREERRRWKNLRSTPDFLDLMGLALSAGQTVEAAWRLASEQLPASDLRDWLILATREFSVGRDRETAVRQLSCRLNDARLSPVFTILFHAMKRGVPLQDIMSDQADSLRSLAMQEIEKKAQTAGIRVLFPIMFLIFPAVFLILFGPLILTYVYGGGFF